MDPSSVHHGGPAPRVPSSFSVGSLDSFFANINHLPPLLSESVTLDSLSSKSSLETIPALFPLSKGLPRCLLLGLGENLKFFSDPPSRGGSPRKPTRAVISSPTSPRLKTMLKECLSIQQWAESSAGWQAPGHIPWSDVTDKASIQSWTPEGSILPADFVSVALLQARARRNSSLKSRRVILSSTTLLAGTSRDKSQGREDEFDDDIVDIIQELTEFQYYFETLPKESDLGSRPLKVPSSTNLAVPSLVISNSHFTFPLPLESSQCISESHPASLASRRGKTTPTPVLTTSKAMADISYPDIPTAFLGTPSREFAPVVDSPTSVFQDEAHSLLRFDEMIHNLRLQCATMEVRTPPVDSTWNSRSAEASPRKNRQTGTLPPRTQEDGDEWTSAKDRVADAEKPSLLRKPSKRRAKTEIVESGKKADRTVVPPITPQKPKSPSPSPTRKPPPVLTPTDHLAKRRVPVPRGNVEAKQTNAINPVSSSLISKPHLRHLPLNSSSRLVSLPHEQLKSSKTLTSRKVSPPTRKTVLPTSKVKVPSVSSVSVPGNPVPVSSSLSSESSSSVLNTPPHEDIKSGPYETHPLSVDNATDRGKPDSNISPVNPILRSAFLKKGSQNTATSPSTKTVRFALPPEELEEDDNLWNGSPRRAAEIPRPVAPFAKTLKEDDALPKKPKTTATTLPPSAPQETHSLLHRSGNLVRKASWKVLPSSRMTTPPKTRPHSVAIGSPLRQSMSIPDSPDINTFNGDDDEQTPLIGTRRMTHSLGRHSLSRIMSLRHPMFSGGGKENKRATIAFSGSTSVGVDENAMRRESQAPGSISNSLQKKSRMPVPLRNILTRFK